MDAVTVEEAGLMTDDELIAIALKSNPGMEYARIENGLSIFLQVTRVINLWRNEECYLAGDQPRGTLEGFPVFRKS